MPLLAHPVWLPVAAAGACWLYFLSGSGMEMSISSMSKLAISPGLSGSGKMRMMHQAMPGLLTTLLMWWTMMLAMMLPGTFPLLWRPGTCPRPSYAATTGFVSGYALAWLLFSVAATGVQSLLTETGVLAAMRLWSTDRHFSAALLAFAGAWQLSPWKLRSLSICRSVGIPPLSARQGFRYGRHCVLATTPLMLLLFVGGVMNVYWVVALTAVATMEKWLSRPHGFSRVTGATCLVMASAVLVS